MDYRRTLTEIEEKSLTYYAEKYGEEPLERLDYIVTVELGRLVSGYGEVDKQKLAEVYAKAEKGDKDTIDAIVAKVAAAETANVEPSPVEPAEPLEP